MKRALALAFLGLAGLVGIGGCVTPMRQDQIDALTTCNDIDLKTIRKSLLLNGYEIKSEGDDDLVTDFKQVAGYGGDRVLHRITVVKNGERSYRFKVRVKEIRLDRPDSMGMSSYGGRRRPGTTVIVDLRQPVEVESEEDRAYVEERERDYEATRYEVCGR